jgi:hypothetical protein
MSKLETELLNDIKELSRDNAGQHLTDFFVSAMTYQEFRENISNESVAKVSRLIELLKDATNLPE